MCKHMDRRKSTFLQRQTQATPRECCSSSSPFYVKPISMKSLHKNCQLALKFTQEFLNECNVLLQLHWQTQHIRQRTQHCRQEHEKILGAHFHVISSWTELSWESMLQTITVTMCFVTSSLTGTYKPPNVICWCFGEQWEQYHRGKTPCSQR